MKINETQEKKLLALDVSGYGGFDAELAIALGFIRKSARFYDAEDINGKKFEFKKQASQQSIDIYKLSQLSDSEKRIPVLFFMHKDGKITEIYKTNYKKLIKAMGLSGWDLHAVSKLYKRAAISETIQMKSPLNFSTIQNFKLIWKRP